METMESTTTTTRTAPPKATPRHTSRVVALDVVRGFALCGILFVNAPSIFRLDYLQPSGELNPVHEFLDLAVQQRFFPIFSLLFGVGFGLMWATAFRRSPKPRLDLTRRLVVLGLLGGLHQLLQPGEALLPYAIVGLALLLPSTWLRGRVATLAPAALGVLLLAAGVWTGGGLGLIPGLFLIGYAAGLAGFVPRVAASVTGTAVVTAAALVGAVAMFWVFGGDRLRIDQVPSATTGLLMATVYVGAVLLLLHTPVRASLSALFAPLGRMALTNYLGATVLLVAVKPFADSLGISGGTTEAWLRLMALCAGLLSLQVVSSHLWLSHFAQGPLEHLWRRATWGPFLRSRHPHPQAR